MNISFASTNQNPGQALVLDRRFAAPRELVFRAWTTAEMVKQWWGCNQFPASLVEMDVRPGGAWRACLRADDGGEIWLAGRFLEVVPHERLVFTFTRTAVPEFGIEPVDTRVTLTFASEGNSTRLQFRQEFFASTELCDSHQQGWTTGFARLDKLFEVIPSRS